jgi:long-chain acyl-CoA synthetase
MAIQTLADIVADRAATAPQDPALIFHDQPLSYGDLNARIERAAAGLAGLGVAPGDRVALLLPNIPEFAVTYYAILRLGAVVVPFNLMYSGDEIAYMCADCGISVIVTATPFYPAVAAALPQAPSVQHVIVAGDAPDGTVPFASLFSGQSARPAVTVAPGDLAVICYTSGTTGRPKGALLSHRNFVANIEQMQCVEKAAQKPGDRTVLVLPLFHIFGMNIGLNWTLAAGGTAILIERFVPEPVAQAVQQYGCTLFLGAPPMYVAWIHLPNLTDYDFSSIRTCISGAAALPAAVLQRFKELTGVAIQEGYGLTETAPVMTCNVAGPVVKPGTVGPPPPGVTVRILDDNDQPLPVGEEGEICCQGENVFSGYWNRPAESAEALRNGWFHSGDIGAMDADGYVTIVDRKKDMINNAGFKVWPREVEEVLFQHPAVKEAAVVALPDPYAGERPMAFVALKDGQQATSDEIIAFCGQRLAKFKMPVRVEFRPDLPKLPTGKVLRRTLRDDARELAKSAETAG